MTDSSASFPAPTRLRSRAQFLLLAVLFFAPFVGAYLILALKPDWRPDGQVNYGQLVNPAVALPIENLRLRDAQGQPVAGNPFGRRWVLLQLLRGPCEDACRRELVLSRQVYTTLGDKRERVVRALVAVQGADLQPVQSAFGAEQPGLLWLQDSASTPQLAGLLATAPDNALLLLDPVGTWLMLYPNVAADPAAVQKDFKGIQKDLRKLLRLSHIG
jgi:hypothetical protein